MSEAPRRHSIWIRWTVFRPVSVFVLFLAILVVGVVAFPRISTQMLPGGLSSGECGVYIPVMDSTPREVMEQIAKPTEDLLRTLPGLKRVISSSGSNRCFIRLEFDPKYDMSVMVAEVRDRVDRAKTSWPDAADRYMIWRQRDSDMPIYIGSMGIEVTDEEVDLDYIFDDVIRPKLERVQGVARVNVWGLLEKRIEIQLDKDLVASYGINLQRVIERLSAENTAVTAGFVRDSGREFLVRVDGRFQSFDEVLDYPATSEFRLRDFAKVDYSTAVRDRLSRVNGKLSRILVVSKESGANAV
ncbi:MAG: efflux RND transporter permease subunit, partial [Planctomycetota bacterium]